MKKKNPHEFKDPEGRIWHEYGVDFESATGKSSIYIWGMSFEHAQLQLDALKETGKIYGRIEAVIPV